MDYLLDILCKNYKNYMLYRHFMLLSLVGIFRKADLRDFTTSNAQKEKSAQI